MQIRPFLETDIEAVKKFADQEIGVGYYSLEELKNSQKQSIDSKTGLISSFILHDPATNTIKGLRLAYSPGQWQHGKGDQLRPDLWPHTLSETAYFQSLFLSADLQGQGWGPKISEATLKIFRELKAKGIATHSWKESPNNSSFRYLSKMGFKTIMEYPLYWVNVDYVCPLDGKPCRCTAIEMYLDLEDKK